MPNPEEVRKVIEQIQELTPSVAVFARAHQLIASGGAEVEDLVKIVRLDTALTAEIVRLSNSGAIAGTQATESLHEAIGRVGFREVERFLALSFSKNVTNRNLACYGISAYNYWATSVSTAIMMELLAKRLRDSSGEAYTIGILHSTGRLVVNQVLEILQLKLSWDWKTPLSQWEIDAVGIDSAAAGAMLLHGWGFSEGTCAIIEHQLEPEKSAKPSKLLKMLNFSIRLLTVLGVGFKAKDWHLPEPDPFLQEFGITLEELKEMLLLAQKQLLLAEAQLGIAIRTGRISDRI